MKFAETRYKNGEEKRKAYESCLRLIINNKRLIVGDP